MCFSLVPRLVYGLKPPLLERECTRWTQTFFFCAFGDYVSGSLCEMGGIKIFFGTQFCVYTRPRSCGTDATRAWRLRTMCVWHQSPWRFSGTLCSQSNVVAPKRQRWCRVGWPIVDEIVFSPQAQHCVVSEGIGDVDFVDWQIVNGIALRALEHCGCTK